MTMNEKKEKYKKAQQEFNSKFESFLDGLSKLPRAESDDGASVERREYISLNKEMYESMAMDIMKMHHDDPRIHFPLMYTVYHYTGKDSKGKDISFHQMLNQRKITAEAQANSAEEDWHLGGYSDDRRKQFAALRKIYNAYCLIYPDATEVKFAETFKNDFIGVSRSYQEDIADWKKKLKRVTSNAVDEWLEYTDYNLINLDDMTEDGTLISDFIGSEELSPELEWMTKEKYFRYRIILDEVIRLCSFKNGENPILFKAMDDSKEASFSVEEWDFVKMILTRNIMFYLKLIRLSEDEAQKPDNKDLYREEAYLPDFAKDAHNDKVGFYRFLTEPAGNESIYEAMMKLKQERLNTILHQTYMAKALGIVGLSKKISCKNLYEMILSDDYKFNDNTIRDIAGIEEKDKKRIIKRYKSFMEDVRNEVLEQNIKVKKKGSSHTEEQRPKIIIEY